MLAYQFVYQTLLADTGVGQLNDSDSLTNPSGIASFVTNRIDSAFRVTTRSPNDGPYAVITIDPLTPDPTMNGEMPGVVARITVYAKADGDLTVITKIGNALYGDFMLQSSGLGTYGIVRRRPVAVVDSTTNPREWSATDTWFESIDPLVFADSDPSIVSYSLAINFKLTSKSS